VAQTDRDRSGNHQVCASEREFCVIVCVSIDSISRERERERDSPQPTRRQQAGQRVSGARRQSQPARALESHQPRKRMPCRRRQCTRRALQQLDIRAHRTLARRRRQQQQQPQQQPTSREKKSPAPATVRRSDRRTLAGRCPAARKWSASASSPASSRPTTTSNTITTARRPTFGPRDTSRSQPCPSSPSTPTPGRYVPPTFLLSYSSHMLCGAYFYARRAA
jgi:hypothetical protein